MTSKELLSLDFSDVLVVLSIAASPIAELRVAIPVAIIQYHFPWYHALPLAIIGNLLPVPLILLFIEAISRYLSRVRFFARVLGWLFAHTRKRGKIIERYERIGLALFVAIPLPFTGAWTGSLAAVLFGLKFKQAILFISIGVIIASIIVTCATVLGWTIFGLYEA